MPEFFRLPREHVTSVRVVSARGSLPFARTAVLGPVTLVFVASGLLGCSGHARLRSATDEDRAFVQAAFAAPAEAVQRGYATWYGPGLTGRPTANGERFRPSARTAAHRSLPFGTWVEVRRMDTGRSVRVRINDRGPWAGRERIIDLSQGAARALDLLHVGVAEVELRVVPGPSEG